MTRCASAVCSLLPRASDITSLRPWKWQQPQFCACSDQAVVLSELQASLQPTFKVHFFFLLIYLDRSVYCRGGGSFRKKKALQLVCICTSYVAVDVTRPCKWCKASWGSPPPHTLLNHFTPAPPVYRRARLFYKPSPSARSLATATPCLPLRFCIVHSRPCNL